MSEFFAFVFGIFYCFVGFYLILKIGEDYFEAIDEKSGIVEIENRFFSSVVEFGLLVIWPIYFIAAFVMNSLRDDPETQDEEGEQ